MKKNLIIVILLALTFGACSNANTKLNSLVESGSSTIKGDKNIVQKEINISDYDAITISGIANVTYVADASKAPYLMVETDNNMLEYLKIEVAGSKLSIGIKSNANISPSKFKVTTNSKNISSIKASGASSFTTNSNLTADNMEVSSSGVSNITLSGLEANKMDVSCSGASKISICKEGKTKDITVSTSGTSNLNIETLTATQVKANASGASKITLKGTAQNVDIDTSGTSNISAKGLSTSSATCTSSGTSSIAIDAKDKLKASASGTSSIRYIGSPTKDSSTSGMASIKSL